MTIEWEIYHDGDGNPFQCVEIDNGSWNFRVDEWEYRYGWRDQNEGVFFHTEIGAIAYAEDQLRLKGGRYRVVKL